MGMTKYSNYTGRKSDFFRLLLIYIVKIKNKLKINLKVFSNLVIGVVAALCPGNVFASTHIEAKG